MDSLPSPTLAELRRRAEAGGLASLPEAEVLQLLLARVAGARAGETARRLLDRFGSLPEVLGAPLPELRQAAPDAAARELRRLHELMTLALQLPFRRRPVLSSHSAVHAYLRLAMAARPREQFRVLFLDRRNRLIADEVMAEGTVDHAQAYPREILRRALELNAAAVLLAHNHPAGDPTPSAADIETTRQVVEAARALRITVHDHLVVAGEGVASFRGLGLL